MNISHLKSKNYEYFLYLDQDRRYLGDIFDNVPKVQSSNSVEFEWSETPHLPTYSLPLVKDGIVVGYVSILFHTCTFYHVSHATYFESSAFKTSQTNLVSVRK